MREPRPTTRQKKTFSLTLGAFVGVTVGFAVIVTAGAFVGDAVATIVFVLPLLVVI